MNTHVCGQRFKIGYFVLHTSNNLHKYNTESLGIAASRHTMLIYWSREQVSHILEWKQTEDIALK